MKKEVKQEEQKVSHKTLVGLVFTILFFFIILTLELPYYTYGFHTSSILVLTGLLIYTIGAIVSRLSFKWVPRHLQLFTNIICFIFVITAYVLAPVLISITPSKECQLVNKKDDIYYYCADSIKKAVSQKKYKEIIEIDDFDPTKDETTLVLEYEDGSKIYQFDNLRILDCASGDTIYGDLNLKYKKNFCGTKEIPNIKTKSN